MSLAKTAPVIISILIILTVAFLRERSRTFAVIAGTMPINLPLTLWITFGGSNATQGSITDFVRSLLMAMIATMVWVVVVWIATNYGWGLIPAVAAGYMMWGLLVLVLISLGYLSVR